MPEIPSNVQEKINEMYAANESYRKLLRTVLDEADADAATPATDEEIVQVVAEHWPQDQAREAVAVARAAFAANEAYDNHIMNGGKVL